MLTKRMEDALVSQFNFEVHSALVYFAMAAFCAEQQYPGFENFFKVQYEEEIFHSNKFYDFINDLDGRVLISDVQSNIRNDYQDIQELLMVAYNHEQVVTQRIYDLVTIANEEKEYATASFLQWFVDEQVEEMKMFKELITKVSRADQTMLYEIDKELQARTFMPPAN